MSEGQLTPEERAQLVEAVARAKARREKVAEVERASGGELTPEERAPLEAHQARLEAQRAELVGREAKLKVRRAERQADEQRRAVESAEARERAQLERLPRTPNLPLFLRRNRDMYVLAEDLLPYLPDGWARTFWEESKRMGKRIGLPPLAYAYLVLLEWVHGLRPGATRAARANGTGCALQASPEQVARILGCSPRYVKKLHNLLDPFSAHRRELKVVRWKNRWRAKRGQPLLREPARPAGAAYVHRFRQLKRYETLTRELPYHQRRARWLDRGSRKQPEGRLRSFADVLGLTYPTLMGCRLLRRRAQKRTRPRPGVRPALQKSPMRLDLYQRLAPLYRGLRARLCAAVGIQFTPSGVKPSCTYSYRPAETRNSGRYSTAGPVGAGRAPPGGVARDSRQAVRTFAELLR